MENKIDIEELRKKRIKNWVAIRDSKSTIIPKDEAQEMIVYYQTEWMK